MKANSIGFSVLVNSGLAERTKARKANAMKNKISVVMMSDVLDLIKSTIDY